MLQSEKRYPVLWLVFERVCSSRSHLEHEFVRRLWCYISAHYHLCAGKIYFFCAQHLRLRLNIFICAQYLRLLAQRLPLRLASLSACLKSLFARPTSLSACSGSGTRHKSNATEAIVEGKDHGRAEAWWGGGLRVWVGQWVHVFCIRTWGDMSSGWSNTASLRTSNKARRGVRSHAVLPSERAHTHTHVYAKRRHTHTNTQILSKVFEHKQGVSGGVGSVIFK